MLGVQTKATRHPLAQLHQLKICFEGYYLVRTTTFTKSSQNDPEFARTGAADLLRNQHPLQLLFE